MLLYVLAEAYICRFIATISFFCQFIATVMLGAYELM